MCAGAGLPLAGAAAPAGDGSRPDGRSASCSGRRSWRQAGSLPRSTWPWSRRSPCRSRPARCWSGTQRARRRLCPARSDPKGPGRSSLSVRAKHLRAWASPMVAIGESSMSAEPPWRPAGARRPVRDRLVLARHCAVKGMPEVQCQCVVGVGGLLDRVRVLSAGRSSRVRHQRTTPGGMKVPGGDAEGSRYLRDALPSPARPPLSHCTPFGHPASH